MSKGKGVQWQQEREKGFQHTCDDWLLEQEILKLKYWSLVYILSQDELIAGSSESVSYPPLVIWDIVNIFAIILTL